jgi:hypothetical protein
MPEPTHPMADPTESRLPAEIKAFLTELRNDAALGPLIDTLEIAFRAIDLEGDSVADAIRFQDGVIWVLKHKNRTVLERIDALAKLANADGGKPGKVVIPGMREFLGWPE